MPKQKRAHPSKDEVLREAYNAWMGLQVFILPPYRLRKVKVVKSIKDGVAQWYGYSDADGGPALDIHLSLHELYADEKWQDIVWTRVGHEMFHAKIEGPLRLLSQRFGLTEAEDSAYNAEREPQLDEFVEACAGVVEAAVLWGKHIMGNNSEGK